MQLTIGSNRLSNIDGAISIRGNQQIFLEWGPLDSRLLLTMDLYGTGGKRIARLRRNHWTFNDNERFEFTTSARGLSVLDTKVSQVALEARVVGPDSVVITQGAFYSSAGHEIEITTENWNGGTGAEAAQRTTHTTAPPFAADEIAAIRTAVVASNATVECPRCGCPLTRERMIGPARQDSFLMSCIVCKRNLVVRNQS